MSYPAVLPHLCLPDAAPQEAFGQRILAELTGQVLFDEDLATGTVTWSGAIQALTGDPQEAFEGLGMEVLEARIHPEDRPRVLAAMLEALATCRSYTCEFQLLHRDGRPRRAVLRGRYLAGADGRPSRSLGILADVTELRQAEHDRQELERQVLHTQKLESLGLLAGGIAHDFNNLLTAVLGNLNLAQLKLSAQSPALPHLESMERTLLRASDLTRQMLAYSGRGRFVVQNHDLNQIIQEINHLLQVCISKRTVVRLHLAEAMPPIEADATQIQQIVLNLVTNASDAIGDRDGTIRITTSAAELDEDYIHTTVPGWPLVPGPHVIMEVSDTGCGMTPEVMARIFDPFFTTKATGRGLGLSAMLSILRGHRGGLKVYSEPGLGTTFKLFFPAGQGLADSREVEAEEDQRKTCGAILLVDDEAAILETTGQALEALGFEVILAANGAEAVEEVSRHGARILLVLMDLTMPQMDGREAFRAIHAQRPEIPILLSSGFSEAETIQEFRGKGLAGFIQKPYLLKDLRRVVMEAVQKAWY